MTTKRGNACLIWLDVLLDTRLGTLAKMNPAYAEEVVLNNYHDRMSDIFPCVDREEYKAAYKARDIETLKRSYITNAPRVINHFVGILQNIEVERVDVEPLRLEINIWPYVMTTEQRDAYLEVMYELFPQVEDISLVSVSEEDLSIEYCKAVYRMIFTYEYADWLEAHAKELETVQAPEMMVYAPSIYHVQVPTDEDLAGIKKQNCMHPFEAALFEIRPFVGLHLLDVMYFSLFKRLDTDPVSPTVNSEVNVNEKWR